MDGFRFVHSMTVRVNDLNYANHVGYQHYLTYFQEARLAYLNHLGFSELDIDGCGMMIAEAVCRYKRELFLNDAIEVGCRVSLLRSKGFRVEYAIARDGLLCAEGHTDCLCYDGGAKKVVKLPEVFRNAVAAFEGI